MGEMDIKCYKKKKTNEGYEWITHNNNTPSRDDSNLSYTNVRNPLKAINIGLDREK